MLFSVHGNNLRMGRHSVLLTNMMVFYSVFIVIFKLWTKWCNNITVHDSHLKLKKFAGTISLGITCANHLSLLDSLSKGAILVYMLRWKFQCKPWTKMDGPQLLAPLIQFCATVKWENLVQTYFSALRDGDLMAQTYISVLPTEHLSHSFLSLDNIDIIQLLMP